MSHAVSLISEPRSQIDEPSSPVERYGAGAPLVMDAGLSLGPWQIAYQTYGTLNAERSNAVLICHALTGDQHVANRNPVTGKPGWWETMVGPGRKPEPDSEVFFTAMSRSMMVPRSMSRRCTASSMRSMSRRRSARFTGGSVMGSS